MNEDTAEKIILALDTSDSEKINCILDELSGVLKYVKIGSATFYRFGYSIIEMIKKRGLNLFIDFKFHDIPNTVAEAVESIIPWGVQMFTIHLSGGENMLKASVQRARDVAERFHVKKPDVVGISVLTSIDENSLKNNLKISTSLKDYIQHLALMAKECGLDGIVASGHEIELIRSVVGKSLKIICPGIRGPEEVKTDQKRTLSAAEALQKGAHYIVIGRPIYQSKNPREVFTKILDEVNHGTR